jgi:outer membrane protein assembly factor BamA
VRSLLGSARNHGIAIFVPSIVWDDRDDEVIPRRGAWSEVNLRLSPPMGTAFPYPYGEVLGIARAYRPLGKHFVLAGRLLIDALFGSPPFYQLTEFDDTYAIGGTIGVRGVPAQRYYGKIKLIANVELRSDVARFRFLKKPWAIALATFLDGGRLWADWSFQPQLDGTSFGLKWGTGVGIRIQQGKAFVVRGDVAWSPDAKPIGGYFAAGEAF